MPEKCECRVDVRCGHVTWLSSDYPRRHSDSCFTVQHVGDCGKSAEYRRVLIDLVRCNEEWNAAVETVIGRPAGWNEQYLAAARRVLGEKLLDDIEDCEE